MTPEQIALARRALGLPNEKNVSYRNTFVGGRGHPNWDDWTVMVLNGEAIQHDGAKVPFGGDDLFKLTGRGALAALQTGEKLDREDFPDNDQHPIAGVRPGHT